MDGTPLAHWAVGAVIFLRFLVPILTSWNSDNDESRRGKNFNFLSLSSFFLLIFYFLPSTRPHPHGSIPNEALLPL